MARVQFLTLAEKIKKLRIELNMKQSDLEDQNITNGFISMIENGKRGLSLDTSKVLVDKFKNKAKILGIKLDIDETYLLNTQAEDAEIYCNKEIINCVSEENCNELILLSKEYNLYTTLGNIYKKIAYIKFNLKDFSNAFINCELAIDMFSKSNKIDEIPFLINKIGSCMLYKNMVSEAIYYFEKSKCLAAEYNNLEIQKDAMYNLALSYNRLDMLDKSNLYINKLIKIDNGLDLRILKALILEKQNNLSQAIEFYENLLIESNYVYDPLVAIVYNNLGLLYLKENDYYNSLRNFNKSQELKELNDDTSLCHTLIEKALVYKAKKDINNSIYFILAGRKLAKQNNDIEYIIKSYNIESEIYEENEDNENLLRVQLELYTAIENTELSIEIIKVCSKIIFLYLKPENTAQVEKYTKIILNIACKLNLYKCEGD